MTAEGAVFLYYIFLTHLLTTRLPDEPVTDGENTLQALIPWRSGLDLGRGSGPLLDAGDCSANRNNRHLRKKCGEKYASISGISSRIGRKMCPHGTIPWSVLMCMKLCEGLKNQGLDIGVKQFTIHCLADTYIYCASPDNGCDLHTRNTTGEFLA